MANKITETPEGYLLLDEMGEVLKNLTVELDKEFTDDPIIDDSEKFITAMYNDGDTGEYFCLFNSYGNLVKTGLSGINYVPNRDEFIVLVNENGDSEVREYRSGGGDYWGVIDSDGSYVIDPKFDDTIEYSEKFDIYFIDKHILIDGESIGFVDKYELRTLNGEFNSELVKFQHGNKYGLLSTEGIVLTAEYDSLDEIEDLDFLIISKDNKKAIFNCINHVKSDFIFEFVSNYPVGMDKTESFITKINGLYGRSSIDDSGNLIEKMPHIYADVKRIVSQGYFTEGFIFQESSTKKYILYDQSLSEIQIDQSETEEAALENYKRLIESIPV
jgi:hypothetical protein